MSRQPIEDSGRFKGCGPFAHSGPIFSPQNIPSHRLMMVVQLGEPMRQSLKLPNGCLEYIIGCLGLRQLGISAVVCRQWSRVVATQRVLAVTPAHMLSLFIQLDTLVGGTDNKMQVSGQASQIAKLLENLAGQLAPEQPPKQVLAEWRGLSTCPAAAENLNLPCTRLESDPIRDYFAALGIVNQVVSLSRQMGRDIPAKQHKYMAHQIALLYQSLGSLGKPGAAVRKDIEGNFARVKGLTEGSKTPMLPEEVSQWLEKKLKEVLRVALPSTSPGVQEKLSPVIQLLR